MMMGKLLLFMFVMVLVGVCGDSVLQCPNITIEGKDGDRVILPCSTKNKTDISLEEVEWLYKDPTTGEAKTVHLYFHGEDYLQRQSDDFKDRTSLFRDQLSSGNCSLSLLLTTSHSGTYYSRVGGRLCCTVTLKVLPAGEDDSSQKHQDDHVSPDKPNNGQTTTHKVGLGVGITAALLPLVIIILVHRYREQLMNFCRRRNANRPQTHLNVSYRAQQTTSQDEESEPEDQNADDERIQMI